MDKDSLKPLCVSKAQKLKPKKLQKEIPQKALSDKALLAKKDQELKQALEDQLYLRAEFENFKKRALEEKSQLIRYSGESFLRSLANEVLDDLDRALAEKQNSYKHLKQGLDLIHKKLFQLLKNYGVEILDPQGKIFDPSYQEALSYSPSSKVPEGHIAQTFKKAYKLHDKVIRPAQVLVAKHKTP